MKHIENLSLATFAPFKLKIFKVLLSIIDIITLWFMQELSILNSSIFFIPCILQLSIFSQYLHCERSKDSNINKFILFKNRLLKLNPMIPRIFNSENFSNR
ncbi:hypothetical protein LUQ84_001619 [Hamiltosporidium tvaerminnensis]|nr:hypothetical protein LUQ84_001619 [Hamiltosporidium tvaerminnensis]